MEHVHPDLRTIAILRRALRRLDRESEQAQIANIKLGSSVAACHVQHALDALMGDVVGPNDPAPFDDYAASRWQAGAGLG
jgi:hypothetical protein